jgi:tRNA modification GTPase
VLIADTAGVREGDDPIEAEGVRRALAWAESAALRLWVVDAAEDGEGWRQARALVRMGDLLLLNKTDLTAGSAGEAASAWAKGLDAETLAISSLDDAGVEVLHDWLRLRVVSDLSGADFPAVTRERHRLRLTEARDHLVRGIAALARGPELAAEDLRLAARALGRIAGRVDAEDVLDVVFARFCIGK